LYPTTERCHVILRFMCEISDCFYETGDVYMRGADIVAQTLARAGVKTIFTLSGNQIMPVFDACIDADIRLIHVRHEAAAVFMADAWAQLTGEIGVALVTAAPGFANALSPLFTARSSESPVLLLSGDSAVAVDAKGPFQELDQAVISAPLVKAAYRPKDAVGLVRDLNDALETSQSGRLGPVHMALAFDVLNNEVSEDAISDANLAASVLQTLEAEGFTMLQATLLAASRPIVLTGPMLNSTRSGGQLDLLADLLDAPVLCMESPRGLKDPAMGDLADVFADADLIICLGKKIDFTLGFGRIPPFDPACRFLVVDPERDALDRARNALEDRLVGAWQADVMSVVEVVIQGEKSISDRQEWRKTVAKAISARAVPKEDIASSGRILPTAVCREVQKVLDQADDPILVIDGGEFGQWAQFGLRAPTRLINGVAGAIGGGICYAIGAKANRPGATVVAVMGDGTAGFHLTEFDTAVRYNLPFIGIIGNDARWNAEYQIQMRDFGPDRMIGCELAPTRYDLAVAGLGGHGEYVTMPEQLPGALSRALASGLPACINIEIEGLAAPSGSGH
jgi:acetolactate synthase-1/2/3 large subunit